MKHEQLNQADSTHALAQAQLGKLTLPEDPDVNGDHSEADGNPSLDFRQAITDCLRIFAARGKALRLSSLSTTDTAALQKPTVLEGGPAADHQIQPAVAGATA
jgi:hypothetical protein